MLSDRGLRFPPGDFEVTSTKNTGDHVQIANKHFYVKSPQKLAFAGFFFTWNCLFDTK